ncbi:DNA-binding protein [Massilia sp. METH4]|uniref:DNA-binding protein n=1 Tax=Massilia sp. METH4 TaxID=3123041 RepID=UPI0030CEF62C
MARSGLTKAQVREVRDRLVAQGRYPSADAVRQALGDTGSKSTIHRYLKELAEEDPAQGGARGETERTLQALVAELADRLHADAERRAQRLVAERDERDAALRQKDAELAELRGTVAALTARLEALESMAPARPTPLGPRERSVQRDGRIAGFGNFGGLLSDSRCAQRDSSPFSILLAGGRSDVLDMDSVAPSGLPIAM